MTLLVGALTLGFILSLLALGVLISFRIFEFPDITPEGAITFGASTAAILLVKGMNPWVASAGGFAAGFIAGITTGLLHTRFKINGLLSGILVMTALYSINLRVMGKSNVPLLDEATLATYCETLGKKLFPDAVDFLVAAVIGFLLFAFMRTNLGTAMRGTGDNQQMMKALGVNVDHMIVLGLGISNGLIGLSGALLAQYQGFADVQMGIGMVVLGLASVIIGEALVGSTNLGLMITGAIMGSLLFRLLVAIALRWGLNPNDLKLITAVFVFIALILPHLLGKLKRNARSQENL
jgi:putative tryptophan/tyrosine transport system permease protein